MHITPLLGGYSKNLLRSKDGKKPSEPWRPGYCAAPGRFFTLSDWTVSAAHSGGPLPLPAVTMSPVLCLDSTWTLIESASPQPGAVRPLHRVHTRQVLASIQLVVLGLGCHSEWHHLGPGCQNEVVSPMPGASQRKAWGQ